jgi:hypothetical protein
MSPQSLVSDGGVGSLMSHTLKYVTLERLSIAPTGRKSDGKERLASHQIFGTKALDRQHYFPVT